MLFYPPLTRKIKIWKNVKSTWRYYPFTYVHHKSRSYDVWFLRYKVQRTKFFVILGHFFFLPFDPPNNPKNQNFEKTKKIPEDIILHLCTTNDNHDVWFLIYQARQTEFFVILGYFLSFYPSNNPEN